MKYYYLKGKKIVETSSVLIWGKNFEENIINNRIGLSNIGPFRVSTVFLGIDYGFHFNTPPKLFETMIFDDKGKEADYQEKYATYKEAEEGHKVAVQYATEKYMDILAKKYKKTK